MKRLLLLSALAFALSNCDTTPRDASTLEKLHGDWYGVEITNYLINQGVWDTLHPHPTTMMTLTLDTGNSTVVIDSAGTVLDTAQLTINNDSSITINSNASNLGWAFDASLINAVGQPVLDSLSQLFTGEQTFNDIDAGYTYIFTPTLYRSWANPNTNVTHTFFARSEAAYNLYRGRWFAIVSGYGQAYETERITHYLSVSGSTNGPFYGIYFGYGLSLKPIQ